MKKVELAALFVAVACGLGLLSGCQSAPDEPERPVGETDDAAGEVKQQVTEKKPCAKEGDSCKFSECCDGQCVAKGNDAAICSGTVVCATEGEVCNKLDCCAGACERGDDGVSRCGAAPVKVLP